MRGLGPGPLRAAVVGCGNIGAVHIKALAAQDGAELVALCDIDPGRLAAGLALAREAGAAGPGPGGFAGLEALLAQARPDVLHICAPHYLHAPMARAALEAGARVLMEKPAAMDLAEGQALLRIQEACGLELGLCFQNRYRPSVAEAARILGSGTYGRLLGIRALLSWRRDASYYSSGNGWRGRWATEGGGLLINQAIHTLDLIQWLGGGCATARAMGGNLSLRGSIEVEDTATVLLELASGARGILMATNAHIEDAPVEIEILCEGARLRLVNDLWVYGREAPVDPGRPGRAGKAEEGPGRLVCRDDSVVSDARRPYWGSGHQALIGDFYACLREGRPFALDLREGLKTLAILDEAYAEIGRPARPQGDKDAG